MKSKKPGSELHDPGYGASRGTFRKSSSDTTAKQPWEADNKIPETLFGYSAKYAIYVEPSDWDFISHIQLHGRRSGKISLHTPLNFIVFKLFNLII